MKNTATEARKSTEKICVFHVCDNSCATTSGATPDWAQYTKNVKEQCRDFNPIEPEQTPRGRHARFKWHWQI